MENKPTDRRVMRPQPRLTRYTTRQNRRILWPNSQLHTLLPLILDDETGKPLASDAQGTVRTAGAALVELQFSGRLVAVKANRLGIVDEPKRTDGLEWAAQRLGTKTEAPSDCDAHLAVARGRRDMGQLLEDLVAGIVEKSRIGFYHSVTYPAHLRREQRWKEARDALLRYATSVNRNTATPLMACFRSTLFVTARSGTGEALATQPRIQKRTEMVPIGPDIIPR